MKAINFKPLKDRMSDKFSWNLYRFFKKYGGRDLSKIKIFLSTENKWSSGGILISCGETEYGIIGEILESIFYGRVSASEYSRDKYKYEVTDKFFEMYKNKGRCNFYPAHSWNFTGMSPEGDRIRTCEYCGKIEVEKKEKVIVENITFEEWNPDEN
jgi:hypothetical protein